MQRDKLKTLAVVAQKGGTGKTTLAVNFAALAASEGLSVGLVDCDPQRSALSWWETREADDITLIKGSASELPSIQDAAQKQGIGLLIVDTRPSVEAETMQAIQSATVAVIPTRPGILDLRAVAATAHLVASSRTPGVIVLNQCPPPRSENEPTLTAEARAVANSLGLPVAGTAISSRVAFSYSLNDGRTAWEYEPGKGADEEIRKLWSHIKKAYLNG